MWSSARCHLVFVFITTHTLVLENSLCLTHVVLQPFVHDCCSLGFTSVRENSDSFRGFIEKLNLFSDRSEALSVPFLPFSYPYYLQKTTTGYWSKPRAASMNYPNGKRGRGGGKIGKFMKQKSPNRLCSGVTLILGGQDNRSLDHHLPSQ